MRSRVRTELRGERRSEERLNLLAEDEGIGGTESRMQVWKYIVLAVASFLASMNTMVPSCSILTSILTIL